MLPGRSLAPPCRRQQPIRGRGEAGPPRADQWRGEAGGSWRATGGLQPALELLLARLGWAGLGWAGELELETKSIRRFVITEKAPTRAFS